MIALEKLDSCPHCGSSTFRTVVPCEDRLYGMVEGLEYARCGACGLLFLSTRVEEDDLSELYPDTYHPYQGAIHGSQGRALSTLPARALLMLFNRVLPEQLRRATGALYTPPRTGATFVDFGCGSASFLAQAAALGWSPIGVDFTPSVVEAVRQSGYQAHLVCDCWSAIGAGSVGAIRMSHVLEHLYNPRETMAQIHDLLAPGGRIHIAVPNPAGVSAKLFGRDWISFDARHTLLYTPRQASQFLDEVGFKDIRIVHETLAKDMARSWGYRRARRGRMAQGDVNGLAEHASLNAAFIIPAKVAALLRRSDRFHVFAKK